MVLLAERIRIIRSIEQKWWLASLLLVLFAASLWARPLLPIDETRYAAVAWEMHITGNWLVPHINGEPYSHKPPLLFWLINIAWLVIGAYDWVPRLVGVLIAFADLCLLQVLANNLWPDRPTLVKTATWLLLGCLTFTFFSTVLMFDLLMMATVLIALIGLVRAARGTPSAWGLFAVGVGLGLLAKGPAVFLYLMPCALLAKWWARRAPIAIGWRWYWHLLLATLLGIAIALIWAIPAIEQGGEEYRQMILWGQTTGRMARAFAHARPWWWYLPLLPVMFLPWTLWLPLWRQIPTIWRNTGLAERFCVAWFAPGLLAFSLISGKQIHYLVPLFPALALLGASCLQQASQPSRLGKVLPVLPFLIAGALAACAPLLASHFGWPTWVRQLSPLPGVGLMLLALAAPVWLNGPNGAARLSVLTVLFVALAHVGILREAVTDHAMPGMNAFLAEQAKQGTPIGFSEDFRDQYPFTSLLGQPAQLVPFKHELAWAKANPQGVLVMEQKGLAAQTLLHAEAFEPSGSRHIVAWRAQTLLDNPSWAARRPDAQSHY